MADNPEGQSCGNCLYFKDSCCRIAPPTILPLPLPNKAFSFVSSFPNVSANDWCGDWKDETPS